MAGDFSNFKIMTNQEMNELLPKLGIKNITKKMVRDLTELNNEVRIYNRLNIVKEQKKTIKHDNTMINIIVLWTPTTTNTRGEMIK